MINKDLEKYLETPASYYEDTQLVYVASPYFHECAKVRQQRVDAALAAVAGLTCEPYQNLVPFSPVVYTCEIEKMLPDAPREGWYAFDLVFLKKCDALLVLELEGWELSKGVSIEIGHALKNGIPVTWGTLDAVLKGEVKIPSQNVIRGGIFDA